MYEKSKVIWEEHVTLMELRKKVPIPHWLQWDAPNLPQNCHFCFDDHHHHLKHPSID